MSRPRFFVVGAPKAGTSSMASYLSQHPSLYLPDRKDVPYFGSDLDYRPKRPNLSEYLGQFEAAKPNHIAGDACASYLQSHHASREIRTFEPRARIVIMLRDPVAAMYSMHSHLRYLRSEDIEDFKDALDAEGERADGTRIPAGTRLTGDLLYRKLFTYTNHVSRFLECFGSDQVLLLLFDDLNANSHVVVRKVYEFLDVDPNFVPDLSVVNSNKSVRIGSLQNIVMSPPPRLLRIFNRIAPQRFHGRLIPYLTERNTIFSGRAKMDPALQQALRSEMAPDIDRLSALIDRDLSAWVRSDTTIGKEAGKDLGEASAHRQG